MKEIVLASQSPRRKELLKICVPEFITDPADIEEEIDRSIPLTNEIERLSLGKAEEVRKRHPECIVIGSDTIVALDGEPMGKPKDKEEAKTMLRKLSGRSHQVITGLAVISEERTFCTHTVSDVTFAELSEKEIEDYVESGEPMDKAGSYAIQGQASRFITGIRGDFFSIIGLPVNALYEEMKNRSLY